jgi:hypothetical protein
VSQFLLPSYRFNIDFTPLISVEIIRRTCGKANFYYEEIRALDPGYLDFMHRKRKGTYRVWWGDSLQLLHSLLLEFVPLRSTQLNALYNPVIIYAKYIEPLTPAFSCATG